MKIHLIYTFDNRNPSQEMKEHSIQPEKLSSRESLSDYVTGFLSDDDRKKLFKISCWIKLEAYEENSIVPQWYLDCDGKLFYENGKVRPPAYMN